MKLTVILGVNSEASFDILLNDNDFVRKWTEELRWHLDNCEFNQQEAFATLLTLQESADILKKSCLTINKYLKNFIEIREDFATQSQEYFNYLHRKFEMLSGGFENPTRLMTIANQELKDAVRQVNFFVHRTETKKKSYPAIYLSFNKDQYRRQPFEEEDYKYHEFVFPPGTLYAHFMELGKEFVDLYEDHLDIDYPGFKNSHFFGGEAWLTLTKPTEAKGINDPLFVEWLQSKGLDPYNKRLGHGRIPLGHIEDIGSVNSMLAKYQYLKEIIIKE